jgi:plasmid maintenance system antidote protein VapI
MDKISIASSNQPGQISLTEFMDPLGLTACRMARELLSSGPFSKTRFLTA